MSLTFLLICAPTSGNATDFALDLGGQGAKPPELKSFPYLGAEGDLLLTFAHGGLHTASGQKAPCS